VAVAAHSAKLIIVQSYKITLVDDQFHIEGFPDAVKAISISGIAPHLSRQLADCVLHRDDLSFSRECVDLLRNADVNIPVVRESLWHSAIIHYCKCFDQSGRIRAVISASRYLPAGNARAGHQFFIDLRNKHLAHDENSYVQASTGAVIAPENKGCKVEKVICSSITSVTLNDENLGILDRLIIEALKWIESRFDQLCEQITEQLEGLPYEILLAQPDMTPYRAPTANDVSIRRQRP
jgi:hypothetical protein